jgi:hypothetical protein
MVSPPPQVKDDEPFFLPSVFIRLIPPSFLWPHTTFWISLFYFYLLSTHTQVLGGGGWKSLKRSVYTWQVIAKRFVDTELDQTKSIWRYITCAQWKFVVSPLFHSFLFFYFRLSFFLWGRVVFDFAREFVVW